MLSAFEFGRATCVIPSFRKVEREGLRVQKIQKRLAERVGIEPTPRHEVSGQRL